MCMCSNANPLHYYVLWVLHKVDRWHWVWSIFNSCAAWADHITCGMSICTVYCRKLRLGMCNCLCSVIMLGEEYNEYSLELCNCLQISFWVLHSRTPLTTAPRSRWENKFHNLTILVIQSVQKNVCLFLMPIHCTITRFGFHARWIDGVNRGLFSIHAPLGETTLCVGRVSV